MNLMTNKKTPMKWGGGIAHAVFWGLGLFLILGCSQAENVSNSAQSTEDGHATEADHGHGDEDEHAHDEPAKGPHRGNLFKTDDFVLEVSIYEQGVPPQFRVYPEYQGNPIPLDEVDLMISLHRLGGRVDEIHFKPEGDYLLGDGVVEEPHSYEMNISVQWQGKDFRWTFNSVEGRVTLVPEAVKRAKIETLKAGPHTVNTVLSLPGEIAFNRNRLVHVVPRVSGVVTEVFKNRGDLVKKGDVLAIFDSRELAEARSEYIESVHRLEFAQASFVREENLWKKKISAEEEYLRSHHELEEAELTRQVKEQKLLALGLKAKELKLLAIEPEGTVQDREVRTPFGRKALTRYVLRAPADGTIVEKHLALGEAIQEAATLFVIADLSRLWGEITIYEKYLNAVQHDQVVTVKNEALGLSSSGKIVYMDAKVDQSTRAIKAHIDLPNEKGLWRPGLFVTVDLIQAAKTVPIAIPLTSIQSFRDWQVAFVRYGDDFEIRPLELGERDGAWVEVRSGLLPGEEYVSQNSFILKADLEKAGASHDH